MKNIIIALSVIVSCFKLTAQKDSDILLTIDNEQIPVSDFRYVYEKNNNKEEKAYSKSSLENSLDLFVKYRLKVKEAETLRMDTNAAFLKEFEGYKKQLAKPYLTEKGTEEKLAKEAYKRLKEDVNTSHILIKVDEYAAPEDTLIAYNKALDIRKKVLAGSDFGQLAIDNSDDPSASMPEYKKGYKGFLGYNPAFSFVYPYETASYNTNVGEVSMPTRSKFGYHIIKVNEKRDSKGEVLVAHIMIDAKDGIDKKDSLAKKNLVDDIYKKLMSGGDWNQLCKEYSIDKRTAANNGEMKPFKMNGKLRVPDFEKVAFGLDKKDEISKPVKSPYGWHIIKLIKKIPLAPYADIEQDLIKQVKRSDRMSQNNTALINRLKKENNFKESKKIKSKLGEYADSTLLSSTWKIPSDYKSSKKIFKLNKEKFTYKDFFTYLEKNQTNTNKITSASYLMSLLYDGYVDKTVYDYEERNLTNKYEAYRLLLKEFRDGILFFDLMEDEVWNKAAKDTAGIRKFYESNPDNYQRKKSVVATVYKTTSKKVWDELLDSIQAGTSERIIKKHFQKESTLDLKVDKGTYVVESHDIISNLDVNQKEHKIENENNYIYVVIKEVIPAGTKPLKKCRGLVISDYQSFIESQWIEKLENKYQVTINESVLNSLVK